MEWMKILSLLLVANANACGAYNILAVFPFPGKSHAILGDGYVNNLLNAGHQVTYITTFPWKHPPRNLTIVDVSSITLPGDVLNIRKLMDKEIDMRDHSLVFNVMANVSMSLMHHENVHKLLEDPKQQFDVVIVEWLFAEIYCVLAVVFECPYIWSGSTQPHTHVLKLIDEAPNPAYTPDIMSSNTIPFSFMERVQELRTQIFSAFAKSFFFTPAEKNAYERIIGPILAKRGRKLPPYEDVTLNASLILGNSHTSMGLATRLPQSFKSIGGYHVNTTLPPLPDELKQVMDGAKNGVIYFSMGSNLKSKELPAQVKRDLLRMFSQLEHIVLWKFEEVLPDLPRNVHIIRWAPQTSILAHPNCRLFISHGGLLSTIEAIHFSVPIIGIPVFGDQFVNVQRAVYKGFAKKVDLSYSLADDLLLAINDVIDNPRYRERVKELSEIYHDRPLSPGQELVFWVEHVVRTKGAPHLRSPALMTPWYQKMYLDLAAVLVLIFGITRIFLQKIIMRKSLVLKEKNQ